MNEKKKEFHPKITTEEKKLLHSAEILLEEKLKDKSRSYKSVIQNKDRFAQMRKTQRLKRSLRPARRKG